MDTVAFAITLDEPFQPIERQPEYPARYAFAPLLETEVLEQPQEQLRMSEERRRPAGRGRRANYVQAEFLSDRRLSPIEQNIVRADGDECVRAVLVPRSLGHPETKQPEESVAHDDLCREGHAAAAMTQANPGRVVGSHAHAA